MELKQILEAILFSAQKPMTSKDLRDLLAAAGGPEGAEEAKPFRKTKDDDVVAALDALRKEHEAAQRSYRLTCVADGWQFVSQPEFAPWLIALVGQKVRPPRLSQPALETLAIIAYRQPITRAEIEQVRGVAVDGVMQTLVERGLVEQVGRAEVVGRPMTYGTTPYFLQYFGLRDLDTLPAAEELRRIPVAKPDALLTTDPGLATAPPDQLAVVEASKLDTPQPAGSASTEAPASAESVASDAAATAAPEAPNASTTVAESRPESPAPEPPATSDNSVDKSEPQS
jgi:segregation and condensation protein B